MEIRPRIKPSLSVTDKFVEVVCLTLLFFMWGFTVHIFFKMPDIIPIHFNAAGEVNNYGSKRTIFLAPVIATIIFWVLSMLNKYPWIFNYMVDITESNAARQYAIATRLLRFLKLNIVIIVAIVTIYIYLSVKGISKGPGLWFLPFVCILMLGPTVYLIIKSFKEK